MKLKYILFLSIFFNSCSILIVTVGIPVSEYKYSLLESDNVLCKKYKDINIKGYTILPTVAPYSDDEYYLEINFKKLKDSANVQLLKIEPFYNIYDTIIPSKNNIYKHGDMTLDFDVKNLKKIKKRKENLYLKVVCAIDSGGIVINREFYYKLYGHKNWERVNRLH